MRIVIEVNSQSRQDLLHALAGTFNELLESHKDGFGRKMENGVYFLAKIEKEDIWHSFELYAGETLIAEVEADNAYNALELFKNGPYNARVRLKQAPMQPDAIIGPDGEQWQVEDDGSLTFVAKEE
jgi:hypothetical protein